MAFEDYWKNEWKVGARICVTDCDWTIGWGKIIKIKEDANWAEVKLDDGKIVTAYKGYSYKLANKDKTLGGVF
jgi:hypothetical protein